MARTVAITFALDAALKGGFTAAFQTASNSARNVASAVREMERSATGRLGSAMLTQREKIRGLAASVKEARGTLATLQAQANASGGANRMLARQIQLAESRVRNLSGALDRQLGLWRNTVAEARTSAGSIRELSREYDVLARNIERGNRISRHLHANMARGEALRSQREDLQGRLLSTAATTASVALPVKLAISAEDTFADLRKVMDAPEEVLQQTFIDAQEISNRTGKSFEDVVSIMTAAAQAGLGKTREELLSVADQAVKMSIAWGVSSEQAGKSMATWRSSMGLTDGQARHTANVINALSNSMNAEAGEIDQIFTRMGPMMASSGMATQDIAALATAFKSAGVQVEVSGTAMKNFSNVLKGGSAGLVDAKKNILNFLKIDPDELQKQFYNDSKGAILRVLDALQEIRPEQRGSVVGTLFGEESVAAISPLVGNLELLREAFKIANEDVGASVDEEYDSRMKTTATSISQMTQSVRNLGVNVGNTLLPAVRIGSNLISSFAQGINGLVQRFPGLTSVLTIAGAGIAALAMGSLALGLFLNTVKSVANSASGVFLRMAASQFTAAAGSTALAGASRLAGIAARFMAGGIRSVLVATGVGAALVALGFAINLLIDNWDQVMAAMSHAWNWVTDTWSRLGVFFTELGTNLSVIFEGFGDAISAPFIRIYDFVTAYWSGLLDFYSGIWNGVVSILASAAAVSISCWESVQNWFTSLWQGINDDASWLWSNISAIWNGAVAFFASIVDGISGVFAGFFNWLREKFSWVFSTIDAISGFVGKITGAVSGAWNKAFGDDNKSTAPAATGESAAKMAASVQKDPVATAVKPPVKEGTRDFNAFQNAAKSGGSKSGGGGRRGGGSSSRPSGTRASMASSSPVTIVSVGGDNTRPQTIFIPAGSAAPGSGSRTSMPAVDNAVKSASSARSLPLAASASPVGGSRQSKRNFPSNINVDLSQKFDLIAQDADSVRRILESIKPDMEELVRNALARIQSDRRRTAYAQ